ncbi:hypothetical protein ACFXPV_20640 [Streptomyces sp. NPDC059118]|uniref:hypothetical protein n=1 Tax=unclassified Streptomyces TaxID=2593676 RepID=UPI00368B8C1B
MARRKRGPVRDADRAGRRASRSRRRVPRPLTVVRRGQVCGRLGPFTVGTNASAAALSLAPGAPAGARIVDKDGAPVTDAENGDQVFLDVPVGAPDGSTELTALATTGVPLGRAFVSTDGPSQTLILAGSSSSAVSAEASVSWAGKGPVPAVTVANN